MWILDSLEKLKFVEQMCICSTTLPPQGLNITWSSGCIIVCRLNPSLLSWIISSQKEDERGQKTFGSKYILPNELYAHKYTNTQKHKCRKQSM